MADKESYFAFPWNDTYSKHIGRGGDLVFYDQPGYGMHAVYFGSVRLPLAPSKINIKVRDRNKVFDLANGDQMTIINDPGLTEYSFDVIIPHDQENWPEAIYEDGYHGPNYYLGMFENLKSFELEEDRVFQFIVIEDQPNPVKISAACVLSDYEITQEAGRYGLDYLVSLELTQYKPHDNKILYLTQDENGNYVLKKDKPLNKALIDAIRETAEKMDPAYQAGAKVIDSIKGLSALHNAIATNGLTVSTNVIKDTAKKLGVDIVEPLSGGEA
jgi:hypothetical protein